MKEEDEAKRKRDRMLRNETNSERLDRLRRESDERLAREGWNGRPPPPSDEVTRASKRQKKDAEGEESEESE